MLGSAGRVLRAIGYGCAAGCAAGRLQAWPLCRPSGISQEQPERLGAVLRCGRCQLWLLQQVPGRCLQSAQAFIIIIIISVMIITCKPPKCDSFGQRLYRARSPDVENKRVRRDRGSSDILFIESSRSQIGIQSLGPVQSTTRPDDSARRCVQDSYPWLRKHRQTHQSHTIV